MLIILVGNIKKYTIEFEQWAGTYVRTIDVMGRYPMDNNAAHIPTHSSGLASVRWNPGGQLHRCVTVPYVSLHVASAVVESFTVHVPSHDPTTVTKSFNKLVPYTNV